MFPPAPSSRPTLGIKRTYHVPQTVAPAPVAPVPATPPEPAAPVAKPAPVAPVPATPPGPKPLKVVAAPGCLYDVVKRLETPALLTILSLAAIADEKLRARLRKEFLCSQFRVAMLASAGYTAVRLNVGVRGEAIYKRTDAPLDEVALERFAALLEQQGQRDADEVLAFMGVRP